MRTYTQEELDALPIMGEITYELREIDGKVVRVPKAALVFALVQPPDEPMVVTDASGQRWMLGLYKGVRYKHRLHTKL